MLSTGFHEHTFAGIIALRDILFSKLGDSGFNAVRILCVYKHFGISK